MSGSPLVVLVVGLLAVGRHLTVANPFQVVDTEEGQLTECAGSADTGTYLIVPEDGCFYVDTSYNRRRVHVASPGELVSYSNRCAITQYGDIIVPSGKDCTFQEKDTFTIFMNIVKEYEETADDEGDEDGSSADYEEPEDEYGADDLLRYHMY